MKPLPDFTRRLKPVGRILELEDWYTWGSSAIDGPDGRVHLFTARWPRETGFRGWSTHSEIAHAVADRAEGPFEVVGTALSGRGGDAWDGRMVHNPTIHNVGSGYALLYVANRDGRPFTQAIGLALADSLDGPWRRSDEPILKPPQYRAWDFALVTNPALLQHPNGECRLYYKSWDMADGKRKVGLAIADRVTGPYRRHPENPVVDYSAGGKQIEDPYAFMLGETFCMILADDNEGVVKRHGGILITSADGVRWSEPALAYDTSGTYFGGEVQRFERPQVLLREGRPAYLYLACKGGRYGLSTSACLGIV